MAESNSGKDRSYKLGAFCTDDVRPMKVAVIGAGFSGIIAAIRLLQRVPGVQLTVYESNAGIGGTWYVNRYPGLACDIPSHGYQISFAPNPEWSAFYSPGPEILAYLNKVVDKYKLRPYIHLQHRVSRAQYQEDYGKWKITTKRPKAGSEGTFEETEDSFDFLIPCIGPLNRWNWPDIEGLDSFKGTLIHSADWKTGEGDPEAGWETTVKSWEDKRVGVIGVGSSAIQIVSALQPKVKSLVNYVRGQTWISTTFVKEHLTELAKDEKADNYKYTEEDKQRFRNPEYYLEYRRKIDRALNAVHPVLLIGNPMQEGAREHFKASMIERLGKRPWIADYLIPSFGVTCRRLTPGAGYLEALCEENVDFVPSPVKKITPTGVETEDGDFKELDVIVCATGFDVSGKLPFQIIGRNGMDLSKKYDPHPEVYMGVATEGFPNMATILGPNSAVGAGSLILIMERQVDYGVEMVLKIQRERLRSIDVKKEAVDDYDEYLESYFPRTVYSTKCRSWYKGGKEEGRILSLWPGSSLQAAIMLKNPRWEDFNYEPLDEGITNRFYWLGNGSTKAEADPRYESAWYLYANEIDIPPVPTD